MSISCFFVQRAKIIFFIRLLDIKRKKIANFVAYNCYMNIQEALKHYFGYDSFRPNQEQVIKTVMGGNDALVIMPTGGGKSLCYQIPAIVMEGTAIVVSPLISLMKDQVDSLRSVGVGAAAIYGNMSKGEAEMIGRQCISGEIKIVFMSPERLLTEMDYLLKPLQISLFAIDEAHCISQWGHDFRPEYTQLSALRERFPQVPIMALTATADKVTRQDIEVQLHIHPQHFISSFDRPNLSLTVKNFSSKPEKLRYILRFLLEHRNEPGIIYCLAKRTTEEVAHELCTRGYHALAYHAGIGMAERTQVQDRFKNDDVQIVCATIAFGMGIDKSNVRWIIHYNMPKNIESYYQEIGRAGRDGAPADTVLFFSTADYSMLRQFALNTPEEEQQRTNMQKLSAMMDYCMAKVCRRRILLNYFGEVSTANCNNCDVCAHPPRRFDGTILCQKALSGIARTHEAVSTTALIDILRGKATRTIAMHGYDHLKTFGVGADVSKAEWNTYILQMIQMGFIEVIRNEYNRLTITSAGWEILHGERKAELAITEEEKPEMGYRRRRTSSVGTSVRSHRTKEIPQVSLSPLSISKGEEDKELFEKLRQLRLTLAREQGTPAYIVLSDRTLHELARIKPTTVSMFGNIIGVGDVKRDKYGPIFTALIRQHLNG